MTMRNEFYTGVGFKLTISRGRDSSYISRISTTSCLQNDANISTLCLHFVPGFPNLGLSLEIVGQEITDSGPY